MDAELEGFGESEFPDGVGEHAEIFVEFLLEAGDVANIVHAFVEAAREFRGDGLDGNSLGGEHGKNEKQLGGGLRGVGFIDRDFGDKGIGTFFVADVAVDGSGFAHGTQKFGGSVFQIDPGDFERCRKAGNTHSTKEFFIFGNELRGIRGFPDVIGDINGEKIAGIEKAVHIGEVDVVGIDVKSTGPAEGFNRIAGFVQDASGFRADDRVFAVGFVPNGDDFDAFGLGGLNGLKLGATFMGEAIPHAKCEFFDFFH